MQRILDNECEKAFKIQWPKYILCCKFKRSDEEKIRT